MGDAGTLRTYPKQLHMGPLMLTSFPTQPCAHPLRRVYDMISDDTLRRILRVDLHLSHVSVSSRLSSGENFTANGMIEYPSSHKRSRFPTSEIVEQASGRPLDPEVFKSQLGSRYLN